MDLWNKFTKMLDHERGKIIGVVLGIAIVAGLVGCEVAVMSDISGQKVTEAQFKLEAQSMSAELEAQRITLNRQIETLNAQVESTAQKLQKAKEFRDGIIEVLAGVAVTASSGGSVDVAQVLMSVLTLAGIGGTIGGVVDANRKNKVITNLKGDG